MCKVVGHRDERDLVLTIRPRTDSRGSPTDVDSTNQSHVKESRAKGQVLNNQVGDIPFLHPTVSRAHTQTDQSTNLAVYASLLADEGVVRVVLFFLNRACEL